MTIKPERHLYLVPKGPDDEDRKDEDRKKVLNDENKEIILKEDDSEKINDQQIRIQNGARDEFRTFFHGWRNFILIGFCILILAAGVLIGGTFGSLTGAGLEIFPFVILAQLAYLGEKNRWLKIASILWLGVLLLAIAFMEIQVSLRAFGVENQVALTKEATKTQVNPILAGLFFWLTLAIIAGGLCFHPNVRLWLSKRLPVDHNSLVHQIAFAMVVPTALMMLAPLITLGKPPLMVLIDREGAAERQINILQQTIFPFIWLFPGAIFAVGYGVKRNLKQVFQRLGLASFSGKQFAIALIAGLGLVGTILIISPVYEILWHLLGGESTNSQQFDTLFKHYLTPLGAGALSLWAGINEEIVIRGVLQPRLGILISNTFFALMHAYQYNIDGIMVVFTVGFILGVLRRKYQTYTSIVAHSTYDFTLMMLTIAVGKKLH